MDFRAKEESFQETDRRYAELAKKREAGSIGEEEFEAERQRLMVRDEKGNWWAKLGESGEWHRRDGGDWVRGTPPGYREAGAANGNLPAGPLSSESPGGEGGGRRRLPLWIPLVGIAGIALIGAVVVFWVLVPYLQGGDSPGGGGEPYAGGRAQGGQAQSGAAFEEVFVHRATSENISDNSTYMDNSLTNDNPDAVLIVTPNWNPGGEGGTYNDHSVGVWYDSGRGKWAIFNQDREAMTEDAAFNVAVK